MRPGYFVVLAFLFGCSGSQASTTASGGPEPAAGAGSSAEQGPTPASPSAPAGTSDAGAADAGGAAPAANARLLTGLDHLCEASTRAVADRSRPLQARLEDIRTAAQSDADLGLALEAVGRAGNDYARVAAEAGRAGFTCPAIDRIGQLRDAHDDDIDPARAAPLAADLDRFCAILGEARADTATEPSQRAQRLAARIDVQISNPVLRRIFGGVATVDPNRRRAEFERQVRAAGARTWRCANLDVLFSAH